MKLLAKSTRYYVVFASIIMLVAIPLFYLAIQRIVLEDLDESLMADKRNVLNHLLEGTKETSIPVNSGVEILPLAKTATIPKDSLYTQQLYDSFSKENIPYRVLQTYIETDDNRSVIRMKRSLIDEQDLIESIISVVVLLLLVIITGMIIINLVYSKKIWSPFYSTLQQLKEFEIEKGNSINLAETAIDEFRDLHKSLHLLTDKSYEAYQSQKSFTENASHELQTPLAVMNGKLELLMQTQPITAEQANLISDLENANRRMIYLNKTLLLLTRIENHQFYDKQPLSINEIVRRTVDQYASRANHKSIRILLKLDDKILITANSSLIEILIGNLLGNAIRHNIIGGYVTISIVRNELKFSNTARNKPLDMNNLVKRFHKESTDNDSLGLGLSICQKICDINGYTLTYDFENTFHSFKLVFQ